MQDEIIGLNEELEQLVAERTRDLAATNERLKRKLSERERVEDDLRKQKEILQKIFDHIPVMIGFFSQEGRIELVNQEWERRLGWTLEEMQKQTPDIYEQFYPDPEERQRVLDFIATAKGEWADFRPRLRDGRMIDTAWAAVSLSDGASIGIGQDITERKRIEERLREYEKVVEGLEEMIVVVNRDYRYLLANRAFLNYRGMERKQVVGRLVPEVLNREIFEKVVKPQLDECLQGKVVKYQMRYTYPKLGERELFLSYFPIEGPGGVDRVACVLQDITERTLAEEQLKSSNEKLRALSARMQSVREEESIRIARELHDELGSALTSLRWDLESLDNAVSNSASEPQSQLPREKIKAMIRLTDTTIGAVRRISSELRPSVLDDLGLVEAIEWQAQQFQARTGILCKFDCSLENLALSQERSTAVFRIFQEALTNILRHAQATEVKMEMEVEAGEFVLTISDDGRGITEDEKSGSQSLGLLGMRERAHFAGGEVNITGGEGKGTVVIVRVPIAD